MNKYEFVYILDAHATQAVKDDINKQVTESLTKSGIKVNQTQVWFERQKMSFAINKIWEGTYYMLNIEGAPSALAKLHGLLRINEQILRYMTIKVEPQAAVAAA